MWIFTVDGYLSVVEYDPPFDKILVPAVYGVKEDGKTIDYKNVITPAVRGADPVNAEYIAKLGGSYSPATKTHLSSHLLVRARVKEDLDPLFEADPNGVYFSDDKADYKYRYIILRSALAEYIGKLIMQIDYWSHVKEEMNKRAPQVPGGRYSSLSAVWSAMGRLQDTPPYGGSSVTYGSNGYKSTDYGSGSYSGYSGYSGSTGYTGAKTYKKDDEKKDEEETFQSALAESIATWSGTVYADDEWVDNPSENPDDPTDDDYDELRNTIKNNGASFDTMRLQLKEFVDDFRIDGIDLDSAVEALVDAHGTCDLNTLKSDSILEVIDSDKAAQF